MSFRDWLLFLPFVGFGITANMLLKTGMNHLHLSGLTIQNICSIALSPWVWGGVACYGIGLMNYLYLLNRFPLNLVQPFSAVALVGVILASRFVIGEQISTERWAGIGLVVIGIIVVGRSA